MKSKPLLFLGLLLLTLSLNRLPLQAVEEGAHLPRKVLILYTPGAASGFWYSRAHQLGAMPLEHLGLNVVYQNIQEGLPNIEDDADLIGVVVFDAVIKNESAAYSLIDYLSNAIDHGKKVVIADEAPWGAILGSHAGLSKANELYNRMGLLALDGWSDLSYEAAIVGKDRDIVGFEKGVEGVLPSYMPMKAIEGKAVSHLDIDDNQQGGPFTMIATSKAGGYLAPGFGYVQEYIGDKEYRKWIVNPFAFFTKALGIEGLPKPDATTLAGRRIFYSHIDGDGWNNISEIDPDSKLKPLSAEVIMQRVIRENKDIPVTVAPIAADIDPAWAGTSKSINAARELLSYEHVEAGTHTYSHPFFWEFFENYTVDKEQPYLNRYKDDTYEVKTFASTVGAWIKNRQHVAYDLAPEEDESFETILQHAGAIPRAFAKMPFDLNMEIIGSKEKIAEVLPKGKKVELLQWTGDCRVYKEALQVADKAGIPAINGGDTRLDAAYPSYAWVRPLSSLGSGIRQYYASMSNENTYTERWSGKFFGFNRLPETLDNTDSPIRLRPANLYYHMYSGQKLSSLNAILQNIAYVKSKKVIPVHASYYANVVKGYYGTAFRKLDEDTYRVIGRGGLSTIRFDKASDKGIDFEKSKGVVGAKHSGGSLYVYLDEKIAEPLIALKWIETMDREPEETTPYLIESRHRAWNFEPLNEGWSFTAQGFGPLEMTWKTPSEGIYEVTALTESGEKKFKTIASKNREVAFSLETGSIKPLKVRITKTDTDTNTQ